MQLPDFRLERFFAANEFSCKHHLTASDCESISVGELLDFEHGSRDSLERLWLGYTESQGHPVLRENISHLYRSMKPGDILVHSGAEEAIFIFMNVALNAGDHVVVQSPCYQSLSDLPRTLGAEVSLWECRFENRWKPDISELKNKLRPNTRAVILNSPHNPTGHLFERNEFQELVDFLWDRNILLFMDEVYRGLEYEPENTLPSAYDLYPNSVSLGVLSKSFGLPGLRVGWIATKNNELLKKMASFKDFTTICNSAPSEFLAILALKNRDKILRRNLELIRNNLGLLDDFIATFSDRIEWVRPRAGCISLLKLKRESDAELFSRNLLKETGVLLAPGSHFNSQGPLVRIGFGRQNFAAGLEELGNYFRSL